jgi:kynureninase
VDFAAWCTYKYLNSGPGSVGGVFIHERHAKEDLPRFAGWWGHDKSTRFKMDKGFVPIEGAEGWQLSNAPVFSMAAHNAALDVFMKAGLDKLQKKSLSLTQYLEFVINDINTSIKDNSKKLEIITPSSRGCQLSVVAHGSGKELYNTLLKNGVICDWREPNVIRMAPVPLYNNHDDIWRFGSILKNALNL